jgi:hypothetical protein
MFIVFLTVSMRLIYRLRDLETAERSALRLISAFCGLDSATHERAERLETPEDTFGPTVRRYDNAHVTGRLMGNELC